MNPEATRGETNSATKPSVKPLYFDISDLLEQDARCVIFRLLGDVSAFVDDVAKIDGLNM